MPEAQSCHYARRKSIWIVLVTACGFFLAAVFLGFWHAAEIRSIVSAQFNEEQLVIAKNVAGLIERELETLEKEILLLSKEIARSPFKPEVRRSRIENSLARVMESGVKKIMIIEPGAKGDRDRLHHYMRGDFWISSVDDEETLPSFPAFSKIPSETVWFSRPDPDNPTITMCMATALPGPEKGLVAFGVNVSWLLEPFLKNIRSGKTGYAWIINDKGFFLYHPEKDFIGRDAFEARKKKDPRISFHSINFIQQEKMLEGMEGTGFYESGWHRGITGRIEKLIAYTPVGVSDFLPQKWSIAVVAPVLEIEGMIRGVHNRQLLLHMLILSGVVAAASALLLFEKKWSRHLEIEVSERTQALRRSEEKYRSLVESAEDFIFTIGPEGNLHSVNPFTAGFFGKSPSDCVNAPLASLFPPNAAKTIHGLAEQVPEEGKSIQGVLEIHEKNRHTWINANLMPLKDKKGNIVSVLCIARDITRQKNLEYRLINAEKLASMGTLAAGVAHEINNPIGVILGFTDLLLQDADPNSQQWEDLKTIERQGLHCKQIVENLLSFARHGREGTERTDICQCIDEVLKIVRHTLEMNDILLETRIAEDLPPVTGDFRQLQQVFLNLINNAVSAMPGGGKISVSACTDDSGRTVIVSLADTGGGIAETDMKRIFEPFYTTKPEGEGTGLGLFVSYGIVNRYGGTIECASQTNTASEHPGTTFTVTLHAAPERTGHEQDSGH